MIQSGKFDSSKMDIKKLANSVLIFTINRLIEISGIIISFIGFLLLIALLTYSPSDPNFIFPENTEINNFLRFQGSYVSDLFLQSVGMIAYLIPVTYIFTGINIFRRKELLILLENTFFIICYCLIGSLFCNIFYKNSFLLPINGNGGFVGDYITGFLFANLDKKYESPIYYFLILSISLLFLRSINFNPKNFYLFLKKFINFIFSKRSKNYTNKNEIINEIIPQDEIKNLIQEDLPFIKTETNQSNKAKFELPSTDLLISPSKNEREKLNKIENNDPQFLEKILLDFGVNGQIKKSQSWSCSNFE